MIQELDLDGVDGIRKAVDYQTDYADVSVIFESSGYVQQFRAYYLRNLRYDWEYVESNTEKGAPFVLLKRR